MVLHPDTKVDDKAKALMILQSLNFSCYYNCNLLEKPVFQSVRLVVYLKNNLALKFDIDLNYTFVNYLTPKSKNR